MAVEITKEIDARGSYCPGPLMELIRAVKGAEIGNVVAVLSSDPGSTKDIPAWIEKAKHELVEIDDQGEYTRIVVKKAR